MQVYIMPMSVQDTTILKHFDKVFETETVKNLKNIDFEKLKLLSKFYEYFEDEIYRPSEEYEKLRKQQTKVSNEIEKTFTDKQKQLFEKHWEITNNMISEEQQQAFMFGFIVAKEFEFEQKISK